MKIFTKLIKAVIMSMVCIFGFVACSGNNKSTESNKPSNNPKTSAVSTWDGTIPGWQAPNLSEKEIKANRPSTYVVDNENNPTTVELNDANAFVWFAYRSFIGANGFKGITVKLNADIDLNNHMWIPIGLGGRSNAPHTPFQGMFDGQGHTIYNLNSGEFMNKIQYGEYVDYSTDKAVTGYYLPYENQSATGIVRIDIPIDIKTNESTDKFDELTYGLFGTTKDATIKNLKIEGVKIDVSTKNFAGGRKLIGDSVGALVGFARGSISIENCTVGKEDHDASMGYVKGGTCEAGLVGRAYAGTDDASISTRPGELGKNEPFGTISIKNCTNNLDVTVSSEKGDKTAGILGYTQFFTNLTIENCTNNGNITGNSYTAGIVAYLAGVEKKPEYGYTDAVLTSHTKITGCVNNGKIVDNTFANSEGSYIGNVGGIMGFRNVTTANNKSTFEFSNCVNHGEIVLNSTGTKGILNIGGLIGNMSVVGATGTIQDCVNDGKLTIGAKNVTKIYAGALVGILNIKGSSASGGKLTVLTCTNAGNIDASGHENVDCDIYNKYEKCFGTVESTTADEENFVLQDKNEIPALISTGKFITE